VITVRLRRLTKRCKFAMYLKQHHSHLKMNSPQLTINRQKGIGLPATVFIIVILALIVVAMSDLTEQSNAGSVQDYQSMRAFYAAESGAQVALNRVFVGGETCNNALADIDFDSGGDNPGLNNCIAELACSSDTVLAVDYMTFTSTATCGTGYEQSTRSIEVRAHD